MKSWNEEVTLTLEKLPAWSYDGHALAVLGHPINHSLSPAMHNAALRALARSDKAYASWKYFRFDVSPEQLPDALLQLHKAGVTGLNLTVPHKVLAFALVQEIDDEVRAIGAVNTLLRTQHGWRGYNTDGYGLTTAVRQDLGVTLRGSHVILLGAGGAARAAAIECLNQGCASLWIGNRTRSNQDTLLDNLRPIAAGTPRQGFDPGCPPTGMPPDALVINATSAGLKPDDPPPIDLQKLPAGLRVFDMIYNPPRTSLLRQAEEMGLSHAHGLSMLVHQGARSLELWTGATAPSQIMQAAALSALNPLNA